MSVITSKIGGNGYKKMIVHLFRDVTQKKDGEMFVHRILEIAQRYHIIPFERKDADHHIAKLTLREREVLTLLARGFSTREIAETLSISMSTVRNHIQNIFEKYNVDSIFSWCYRGAEGTSVACRKPKEVWRVIGEVYSELKAKYNL